MPKRQPPSCPSGWSRARPRDLDVRQVDDPSPSQPVRRHPAAGTHAAADPATAPCRPPLECLEHADEVLALQTFLSAPGLARLSGAASSLRDEHAHQRRCPRRRQSPDADSTVSATRTIRRKLVTVALKEHVLGAAEADTSAPKTAWRCRAGCPHCVRPSCGTWSASAMIQAKGPVSFGACVSI